MRGGRASAAIGGQRTVWGRGAAGGRRGVPGGVCERLLVPHRTKRRIPLVPENLLKKRKAYQAIKATQAKQALLDKRKVGAAGGFPRESTSVVFVGLRVKLVCCAIYRVCPVTYVKGLLYSQGGSGSQTNNAQ